VDDILGKGFEALMAGSRATDLARMYRLFGRVAAHDRMRAALQAYTKVRGAVSLSLCISLSFLCVLISVSPLHLPLSPLSSPPLQKTGSALVTDITRDATLVQELLDLKTRLDGLLEHAFAGNEAFSHAMREAFESFINMRQNKPAELIGAGGVCLSSLQFSSLSVCISLSLYLSLWTDCCCSQVCGR
jgi:hypothetical protein